MRKVRMLRSQPGSPNGITVVSYKQGQEYSEDEMGSDLMSVFVSIGAAELVEEEEAAPVEQKAIPSAPQNQAIKEAPLNKSAATEGKKEKEESKSSSVFKRRRGLERSR